jgi:hypothetical protein
LENGGTTLWTGTTITMDSAVITNRAGALFDAQNAATLMQRSGLNRFDNAGTFRKSGPPGMTTLTTSVSLNNYNTVGGIQAGSELQAIGGVRNGRPGQLDVLPNTLGLQPGDVTAASNSASRLDAWTSSNRFYRVRLVP